MDVTNLSGSRQAFFEAAYITVTCQTDRGEYVYQGFVQQGASSGEYPTKVGDFYPIDPLYHGYYIFYCALPNAAFESQGRITLDIQLGDTTMTWVYREK